MLRAAADVGAIVRGVKKEEEEEEEEYGDGGNEGAEATFARVMQYQALAVANLGEHAARRHHVHCGR